MSTSVPDLPGVILTFCEPLTSEETHQSKIARIEQQRVAAEGAIETTLEMVSPVHR